MTSPSRFLQDRIALFSGGRAEASEALWGSPDLPELYPALLRHAYAVIRTSVPLMEAAVAEGRRRGDAVGLGLAAYLARHIPEERGHDLWMREDLALLGEDVAALDAAPTPILAASLVGAQYTWIHHAHPVAILGYLAVLEGNPPDPAFFEAAAARSGLPLAAFRTYLLHARLDPGHRDELFAALDALPLEPQHLQLLSLSALHSCQVLEQTLRAVVAQHQARRGAVGVA
jgi:hypothetical protein